MKSYVAFLRGINVGAKHRVNMAELTRVLEAAGYQKVRTYINSGNVLFESAGEEAALREEMAHLLESAFGFPIPVMIRTAEEMLVILDRCPFTQEEVKAAEEKSQAESLHIGMFHEPPSEKDVQRLKDTPSGGDRFVILGRDIYMLLDNGVHLSKLAERAAKLSVPVTMRNSKTMQKLSQMAGSGKE